MNVFSNRLKLPRKEKNVYQNDISLLFNVAERHYRDYEAGRIDPSSSK